MTKITDSKTIELLEKILHLAQECHELSEQRADRNEADCGVNPADEIIELLVRSADLGRGITPHEARARLNERRAKLNAQ